MKATIMVASGKATCKLCKTKIDEGEDCIGVSGYRDSGYIHRNCGNKFWKWAKAERKRFLKEWNIAWPA